MAGGFAGPIITGIMLMIVGIVISSLNIPFVEDNIFLISGLIIFGGTAIVGITIYKAIT